MVHHLLHHIQNRLADTLHIRHDALKSLGQSAPQVKMELEDNVPSVVKVGVERILSRDGLAC